MNGIDLDAPTVILGVFAVFVALWGQDWLKLRSRRRTASDDLRRPSW